MVLKLCDISLYILGGTDLQEGQRKDLFVFSLKPTSGACNWSTANLKGPYPRKIPNCMVF